MSKSKQILFLPGDGIGPEVSDEAEKVLLYVAQKYDFDIEVTKRLIGGIAIDEEGSPISDSTIEVAKESDAVFLGGVGGPKWDSLEPAKKPEKGLLKIRSELDLFANLRPSMAFPGLEDASSLKRDVIEGLDILIVRELTGGIYFGTPREIKTDSAFNTMIYSTSEVERIAEVAFKSAMKRDKKLCSVDKANVLEVSEFWRSVVNKISKKYPEVILEHMLVDNAAMQLVQNPKQFDVILSSNLFGDILSDISSILSGSIGMLPSASLDLNSKGLFEPVHGTAPDIAGKSIANPLASILSIAMMFKYTFANETISLAIAKAVEGVLKEGFATRDIANEKSKLVSTSEMGDLVIEKLK
ncbi:MAG: 3-isopropylmalate dehydrogenase [Gammaproteobacteria bacterium]|tara:strand:- start:4576 stop:5643 length:1068 start_codon:yes stop_codon:yes gene_type:complete